MPKHHKDHTHETFCDAETQATGAKPAPWWGVHEEGGFVHLKLISIVLENPLKTTTTCDRVPGKIACRVAVIGLQVAVFVLQQGG